MNSKFSMGQRLAKVTGIILAAGQSSRMGRDKLSLPFRGVPLLQHSINAARESSLEEVILVLSKDYKLDNLDTTGCKIVHPPGKRYSQSSSLKAGLSAVGKPSQGAMVLLGDQPLLKAVTLDFLLWSFSQQSQYWIVPEQEGMRGNPVIIPNSWFQEVLQIEGDNGAKKILERVETPLRLIKIEDPGPFIDIDTDHEYQLFLKHYEKNREDDV